MARASAVPALSIWANGERVGTWRIPAPGADELRYDDAWVDAPAGRPLSLSLPLVGGFTHKGAVVRNYFDNLLPDSQPIRERIASRFRTHTTDPFDLLQAIGRDCVGAIQLLGEQDRPAAVDRIEGEPMSEADVERLLQQTVDPGRFAAPSATEDELRISLAGAQEKTALLWHEGQWLRPRGSTPTTHILKLPLGLVGHRQADFSTSVENEWLCLNILQEYGIDVPRTAILRFGAQKALAVERFDRRLHSSGNWWLRLPQEDFCQALGAPGPRKYEADGGPGMLDLADVLRNSIAAAQDLATLITVQLLFWLLAATDGHAKNFSIFLERGGGYRLAPLYDVLSAWPVIGTGPNHISWHKARLAMAIRSRNAHWKLAEILPRHWDVVAKLAGLANAQALRAEIIETLPDVIDRVRTQMPTHFPEQVASAIFEGMKSNAKRLAASDAP